MRPVRIMSINVSLPLPFLPPPIHAVVLPSCPPRPRSRPGPLPAFPCSRLPPPPLLPSCSLSPCHLHSPSLPSCPSPSRIPCFLAILAAHQGLAYRLQCSDARIIKMNGIVGEPMLFCKLKPTNAKTFRSAQKAQKYENIFELHKHIQKTKMLTKLKTCQMPPLPSPG